MTLLWIALASLAVALLVSFCGMAELLARLRRLEEGGSTDVTSQRTGREPRRLTQVGSDVSGVVLVLSDSCLSCDEIAVQLLKEGIDELWAVASSARFPALASHLGTRFWDRDALPLLASELATPLTPFVWRVRDGHAVGGAPVASFEELADLIATEVKQEILP